MRGQLKYFSRTLPHHYSPNFCVQTVKFLDTNTVKSGFKRTFSSVTHPVIMSTKQVHDNVKQYYGSCLESTCDLQTSAACSLSCRPIPKSAMEALNLVHPAVTKRETSGLQNLGPRQRFPQRLLCPQ